MPSHWAAAFALAVALVVITTVFAWSADVSASPFATRPRRRTNPSTD